MASDNSNSANEPNGADQPSSEAMEAARQALRAAFQQQQPSQPQGAPAAPAPAAPDPMADAQQSLLSAFGQQQQQQQAPSAAPGSNESVSIKPAAIPQTLLDQAPAGVYPLPTPEQQAQGAPPKPTDDSITPLGSGLEAMGGGVAKALFAVHDAVLGQPDPGTESPVRAAIEEGTNKVDQSSALDSFTENVTQFGVGMLGVGEAGKAMALTKGAGEILTAASTKVGPWASNAFKAALAGSVFFDPHSGNMANVVQSVPGLHNPITAFLSDNDNEAPWLDRAKNALTSIGVDAALQGVMLAGMKVVRAIKLGSPAALRDAHDELQSAVQDQQEQQGVQQSQSQASQQQSPSSSSSASTSTSSSALNDTGIPRDETVSEHPESVEAVQSPTQGAGPEGLPPNPHGADYFTPDDIASLMKTSEDDALALEKYGTWENAIANGHTFGPAYRLPWQLISNSGNPVSAIDALMFRASSLVREKLEAEKGGAAISDAMNDEMVRARAKLWAEDPAALLGALHVMGKNTEQLRANIQATFQVAQMAYQAAFQINERIRLGDLSQWNGDAAAATEAFTNIMNLATTAWSTANASLSNTGRALRGARGEFAPNAKMLDLFSQASGNVDPKLLSDLVHDTRGDPRQITKLTNPSLWSPQGLAGQLKDAGEFWRFLMINGFISSPFTHGIILASNGYQLLGRPLQRIMGAGIRAGLQKAKVIAADDPAATHPGLNGNGAIAYAALKQYRYMATSVLDAIQAAKKAFTIADSVIDPHSFEGTELSIGQRIALMGWRPWTSPTSVLRNLLTTLPMKAIGMPSRVVTLQDEFVRQVAYRSLLSAEAEQQGIRMGLDGAALSEHIRDSVASGFDEFGHATNERLLNEANITTAQQSLDVPTWNNRNSFGETATNFRNSHPNAATSTVPFIKTPANLFRERVNLTPGLNLLRRQYLGQIRGEFGPQQQTQAVGQMAAGLLLYFGARLLAHEDRVTGSGPTDGKVLSDLEKTGWRSHSFVFKHDDGSKTYVPFDRFDPVSGPLGMAADLSYLENLPSVATESKVETLSEGILWTLVHNLTDHLYLDNFERMLSAVTNPSQAGREAGEFLRSMFVPYSALLRSPLAGDPYMRDANDLTQQVMENVPGLSEKLPPKRDAWGDPITHANPWWSNSSPSIADQELQRLALEQNTGIGAPSPRTREGVDLRDITMADGRNAFDKYQELARQPGPGMPTLKEQAERLIASDGYQNLVDGDMADRGTKDWALGTLIHQYREAARYELLRDPNVAQALYQRRVGVRNALAAKHPNPTVPNKVSKALTDLGNAFGIDLHAAAGGAAPQATPAPLPPDSKLQ